MGMINGATGTSLKKDNIGKHSTSKIHETAMRLEEQPMSVADIYKSTDIGRSFRSSEAEERARIGKLIEIAYLLAWKEKPLTMFVDIVQLEKRHGVPLGMTYHTDKMASEFTECIAEELLGRSQYFSIYVDGSTDITVVERELIYISFIDKREHSPLPTCMKFLAIKSPTDSTALGVTSCINSVLEEFNLQEANASMVGFCADGASVNMGHRSGVAAKLKNSNPPRDWLVVVHCQNHRLELAAKDAFANSGVTEVMTMLNSMYAVYSRSFKRLRDLKTLADVMEDSITKLVKANGTRWVQFKSRACVALLKSYPYIISHLENEAAATSTVPADKAKLLGYLRILKGVKFLITLVFFKEVLEPLSQLSLSLQKTAVSFDSSMASLDTFYQSVEKLKELCQVQPTVTVVVKQEDHEDVAEPAEVHDVVDENEMDDVDESDDNVEVEVVEDEPAEVEPPAKKHAVEGLDFKDVVEELKRKIDAGAPLTYRGITLSGQVSIDAMKVKLLGLLEKVEKCVRNRLGDINEDIQLKPVRLMNTRVWPREKETLLGFGVDEVVTFTEHFSSLVESRGCCPDDLLSEWNRFKTFWLMNMTQLAPDETWQVLINHYTKQYPNLVHMISVLLLIPVSNDNRRRGFSTMGRVKTDERNRISSQSLDQLMRISLDGPEPEVYDSTKATEGFFTKKKRRPNQGSR
ncbi:zinc finger protein 862-like [Amphiura filiformis]|uniref:zinc finger protein 862-like n=1 Tax=Amphiura filiformis TaxID=82378 RepID=UPI003B228BDD